MKQTAVITGYRKQMLLSRMARAGERKIVYKRRRFIPPVEDTGTLVEHTVIQGERLDNIAARYMGDPTQFWRICDANLILKPDELTDEVRPLDKDSTSAPVRGRLCWQVSLACVLSSG